MISVQVEDSLIDEFDIVRGKLGFSSRSKALRESIQFFIEKNQSEIVIEGHKIANMIVQYDGPNEIVSNRFSTLTNKYNHLIKSINQYNLKTNIIQTMIVAGFAEEIQEFYNEVMISKNFKTTITYLIV